MGKNSMKQKLEEAKGIYFARDFRAFMRKLQGLTDDDFNKPVQRIKEKVLNATEKDPLEMLERIFNEIVSEWEASSPLPINTEWHHFIVPGVVMAALRNCGYPPTDRDVEEAMSRGEKFPGGSCGFAGTCGGAYGAGVVLSVLKKTNPLHDTERGEIMEFVADTLKQIAKYPRRCCKRSAFIALQSITKYLNEHGYERLPFRQKITCSWSAQNKMCLGLKCPFFNQSPGEGHSSECC